MRGTEATDNAETLTPGVGLQRQVSARSTRHRAAFTLGRFRFIVARRRKLTPKIVRERELTMIYLPCLSVTISDRAWHATQ